jgi:flagellar FliJ protein
MFKFRLEPLITIRDNVLKERQTALAAAYSERRILEEHNQDIERQLAEGLETARSLMQTGQTVNVEHFISLRNQESFLRDEQEKVFQQMKKVDEKIEQCRHAVVEANKELKSVEKLKEKRYEEYREEEKKA